MGTLGLLMLLHVVVICGLLAARALHAKLSPLAVPALAAAVAGPVALVSVPKALLTGRQFEEYVQAGLVELRIMLVQAARRRRDG